MKHGYVNEALIGTLCIRVKGAAVGYSKRDTPLSVCGLWSFQFQIRLLWPSGSGHAGPW